MPKLNWDAFQDSHFRPHLVVVHLAGINPTAGTSLLDNWLVNALGGYALKQEGQAILVAFEMDSEAARFSSVLQATPLGRGQEWASKAEARLDGAARRRLSRASRREREKRRP